MSPPAGSGARGGRNAAAALRAAHAASKASSTAKSRVGAEESCPYRATFFRAYPELEGKVVVHHAVEQQVLNRYPGVFSKAEIHSLENLRGIPKDINSDVHLSQIRREWNKFYRETPNPTKSQFRQKAKQIDSKLGSQFRPPRR